MDRIRVLHFTKVINRNDFIDVIVRQADRSRFLIFASSYDGYSNIENPEYEKNNISFYPLNIKHGYKDLLIGAWRLSKILRRQRIQLLHTHHYYESVIGRIACWLYPACKHIVGRHYHDQFYLTTSGFKLKYYLFVESVVNHFASAIIVPSTAIVELLRTQNVKEEKIKMIPYGFDFNSARYQPLPEDEITILRKDMGWSSKFIIGNVGRHHIIKGQTYLLKAFKRIREQIPNSVLVMIGDGPLHDQLLAEAKQLSIADHVQFLGWRRDSHKLINAMDIVVHPTLQEAFPQIMIETMALAKPIVITPVSGASDVIEDGRNGLLIPIKNIDKIVEKISMIFTNQETRKKISEDAALFVRAHFSIQRIIPRFENLYSSLIGK
jgi:glycosyltransferase involved in cell wall biosynthesis